MNDDSLNENILTGEKSLMYYKSLLNFPVSMSCIASSDNDNQNIESKNDESKNDESKNDESKNDESKNDESKNDKTMDMNFWICKDTGIIQIKPVPSFDDIYIDAHNTSYGGVWRNLFNLFVNELEVFISDDLKYEEIDILEIGGGSLMLANKILTSPKIGNQINLYKVYEKNISVQLSNDSRIEIVPEYLTNETDLQRSFSGNNIQLILHSHVIEHVWNPNEFITIIRKILLLSYQNTNQNNNSNNNLLKHCFIAPNLQSTFAKKYTNALNFEHNFYITEPFIDTILHNNGFEIIRKVMYLDHSILYFTQISQLSTSNPNSNSNIKPFPNLYSVYKSHLDEFFKYHQTLVHRINKSVQKVQLPIYLYGAHIFSQYLIAFGLKVDKIKCILDNSPQKQQKRLYGTSLRVFDPSCIVNDTDGCIVILKAASYQEEIRKQLTELNHRVIIIE